MALLMFESLLPRKTKNNLPFRPIVANRSTMLQARVSKTLSTILLPYLDQFTSIINSSSNLVQILEIRLLKPPETMVITPKIENSQICDF